MTTVLPTEFYTACLTHYEAVSGMGCVLSDVIPIPFFGDVRAYQASPIKVITAAINPSDKEFPTKGLPRFDTEFGASGPEPLETVLSSYFHGNPYTRWFSAFENVLTGLDTSFGGKLAQTHCTNTAVHIDFCSPIATDPTWTGLTVDEKAKLEPFGKVICSKLIDNLKPDVLIASMGRGKMRQFGTEYAVDQSWDVLQRHMHKEDRSPYRSPLLLSAKPLRTTSGHPFVMVYGSGAILPFGNFSNARKFQAGQTIRARLGK